MKRLFLLLISAILIATLVAPASVSAAEDFYFKEFDKAYVTFVFDDCYETLPSKYKGNFFEETLKMFKDYNFPMCMAATANEAKVESKRKLLEKLQAAGGEVLSHTVDHTVLTKDNSTVEVFEKQLGDSYAILSAYGFKVNGIIATGNNGGENTANFELMEPITRKYYKYSNLYGVSTQYDYKKIDKDGIQRRWITTFEDTKKIIDQAIEEKKWVVLSAHNFGEIPKTELDAVLSYLDKNFLRVEVVTWNYIYENFGVYSGPQVPTAEALAKVEEYKKTLAETEEDTSSVTSSVAQETTSEIESNSSKVESTTSSNVQATTSSNVQATTSSNVQVTTSSNVQATTSSNIQATTSSNVQATTSSNVQATTSSNVQATTSSNIQAPTSSNIQAPTSSNVQAPTSSNVQAPTSSNIQAPTSSNVQAPTSSNVQATTSSNVQATTSSNIQAPTSSNVQATTSSNVQATTSSNVQATTSSDVQSVPSWNQQFIPPYTDQSVTSSVVQEPTSSEIENVSVPETVSSTNTDSGTVIDQVPQQDTTTTGEETTPVKSDNKILIAVIILVAVLAVCVVAIIFTIKYIKKLNQ